MQRSLKRLWPKTEEETRPACGCIGSRNLAVLAINRCRAVGRFLAREGWIVRTGAAEGADQAFAEGALSVGGRVVLCLPDPLYQDAWIRKLRGDLRITILNNQKRAWKSVDLHPAAKRLTEDVRRLHARNGLIVDTTKFIIAHPITKPNGRRGGTGQGIRIATHWDIPIVDLERSGWPDAKDRIRSLVRDHA